MFLKVPENQEKIDPVGRPVAHVSACKQATGEAIYIDDTPPFENELHAAFLLSTRAHAAILTVDLSEATQVEGFHAFFSAKDLPGARNFSPCIYLAVFH